jgi:hypothetical protein
MNPTDRAAMIDYLTEQRRHYRALAEASERLIKSLQGNGQSSVVKISDLCYTNGSAPQGIANTTSSTLPLSHK